VQHAVDLLVDLELLEPAEPYGLFNHLFVFAIEKIILTGLNNIG
jgi:hypothetical protein